MDLNVKSVQPRDVIAISTLSGLWTRSFKSWSDGRCDTTTEVGWLQGVGLYGDLRQRPPQPDFSHVTGLDSCTIADCAWLAKQEAFAGTFRPSGENVEWVRLVDLHPPRPTPDIGRIYWHDDVLVEEGLQGEYIEHWNRTPNLPAAPCAGFAFDETATSPWGCLVRVADMFIYARGRSMSFTGDGLAEAVAAAPDVQTARRLIDFELSFGHVGPYGWRIARSTLPFRVGDDLGPAVVDGTVTVSDRAAAGTRTLRHWQIAHTEGEVSILSG